ncbi:bifunctional 3'-5' exonuclease/DNA polymerase [Microbacterium sp. SLBN-146]|uniref:bifunctional 3'-5' exonuclease/DNA polymerase n=1 Tax=Microbacterium sp. SLBN-146 TaxID=2768457 RepID=UPI00114EB670|nr:bifunctional 3'-5' exonuclease/DNA polymerase [Microbacterium sp. SLBN-146]TQJ32107.1 DNA polymerase-1 [Microbacterium sp. SLBN-146]
MSGGPEPAWIVLGRAEGTAVAAVALDIEGQELSRDRIAQADVPGWVEREEQRHRPRWVWSDAPQWYGPIVAAGHRVARCHDLRLVHAILRDSALVRPEAPVKDPSSWDSPPAEQDTRGATLFDLADAESVTTPHDIDEALAEFQRQRAAIAEGADATRLRLLAAAESAGALIAVELRAAGVPWDAGKHDAILQDALGPRPHSGGVPTKMLTAADRVRTALGDPAVSLDSQPKLLRALHRSGVQVASTSRWELAQHTHPVIEPLLEYKKLARLLSANGWAWLDDWVAGGRFRPVYVPGGVVTGRWASSGGGALQLPRQLRAAVRADPGWKLVVADVAQLEPRVLAGMSRDMALADAARGRDLYSGIVDSGAAATRDEAKLAILGAMYGATTGDSGRLVPRLRRIFPRAMALVDDAARVGEDGGIVTTWLGRSSPPPSSEWVEILARATEADATPAQELGARRLARDRGRFTRNFVVQGTAAEWALAWLADLRLRLAELRGSAADAGHSRSGPAFAEHPHLAFFLHDEVIVHAPASTADAVADAIAGAADAAGHLLFGDFPLDFPLDLRITDSAEKS